MRVLISLPPLLPERLYPCVRDVFGLPWGTSSRLERIEHRRQDWHRLQGRARRNAAYERSVIKFIGD